MTVTPKLFSVNSAAVDFAFSFGTILLWVFCSHLCLYVPFTFILWCGKTSILMKRGKLLFLADKRLGPDRKSDSPVRLWVIETPKQWKEMILQDPGLLISEFQENAINQW